MPLPLSLLAVTALTLTGAAPEGGSLPPPPPPGGSVQTITYAEVGGTPLELDLYLPAPGGDPAPLIIWVHGGGWSGGSKFPAPYYLTSLTSDGFAVASIDYRLTSQAGGYGAEPVTFPAQIHDVKGAVRFLRAHATDYNLDPERFAAAGSSAGGHLVALLGTSGDVPQLEGVVGGNLDQSSRVQAVFDLYGPTDLLDMNDMVTTPPGSMIDHDAFNSPESRLLGWSAPGQGIGDIKANIDNPNAPYPALVALAADANPITHVTPDDPPIIIAHGTWDASVPFGQSSALQAALLTTSVEHEFIAVHQAGHGNFPGAVTQAGVAFLKEHLAGAPPPCDGDANGDGVVDSSDLNDVLGEFGQSCDE